MASKQLILIDPGVHELLTKTEYSNIEKLHQLAQGQLQHNEYLSIDYPCDMNLEMSEEFIERSIHNNFTYKDNDRYICTVQSNFEDIIDFRKQFDLLEPIFKTNPQKVIGIGNMCKIHRPNSFTDAVIDYIARHVQNGRWIHFYGLGKYLIERYAPLLDGRFRLSTDSNKWTLYTGDKELVEKYHYACAESEYRNDALFFRAYIRDIQLILKRSAQITMKKVKIEF